MSEYWSIRDARGLWLGTSSPTLIWHRDRLPRHRFATRDNARATLRNVRISVPDARLVRVRVRPRSERIWMAERIKAWEPVVRAAIAWTASEALTYQDQLARLEAFDSAVRAMPEEHRP